MKQKHIWVIFWRYEAKGLQPGQTHIVACATKKDAAARVKSLRMTGTERYWAVVADPVRFTAQ